MCTKQPIPLNGKTIQMSRSMDKVVQKTMLFETSNVSKTPRAHGQGNWKQTIIFKFLEGLLHFDLTSITLSHPNVSLAIETTMKGSCRSGTLFHPLVSPSVSLVVLLGFSLFQSKSYDSRSVITTTILGVPVLLADVEVRREVNAWVLIV